MGTTTGDRAGSATDDGTTGGGRLAGLVDATRRLVGSLDPSVLSGGDAARAVEGFARLEKLAAAGKVVCAARAAEGSAWSAAGERTPERWLARRSGSSVADAERVLATSKRLGSCPATDAALRQGALSAAQAAEVSAAAVADPAAEERLVALAQREGIKALRDEAARVRAAADGPGAEARARRHRAGRHLRRGTGPDGECTFSGSCGTFQGAAIWSMLGRWRDTVFAQARADGRREPLDAYTLDALELALRASLGLDAPAAAPPTDPVSDPTADTPTDADPQPSADPRGGEPSAGGTTPTAPTPSTPPTPTNRPVLRPSGSPRHKIIVHVSHTALLRGHTVPGERCEIDGAGPVPVTDVQALLDSGDAFLAAVVTDGVDVHRVVHVGRHIPEVIRTALDVRDRACVVPGCGNTGYFEIDHTTSATGYADTERTRLDELARLCTAHHHQKTTGGAVLSGGPGRWHWQPPPDPITRPHPSDRHRGAGRSPPDPHPA